MARIFCEIDRKIKDTAGRREMIAGFGAAALSGLFPFPARSEMAVKGTVIGQNGWLFLLWDDPRRADYAGLSRVAQVVKGVVDILKAAKIDLVIVLPPSKARVYREFLPTDVSISPEFERRYHVASEQFRAGGALVPDLESLFVGMRKSAPDRQLWFKVDTHWTALGGEAAAVAVAREIKAKVPLPPSTRHGMQFGPEVAETHYKSDLATVLPPAQRALYPDEQFKVRRPLPQAGGALLDEDAADVAVVGSSYMEPRYNFSEMLSNQLDRPVALHWHIHSVGPYQTMLRYLQTDAFKKHRPKVIVWNLLEIDTDVPPDDRAAWLGSTIAPDQFLDGMHKSVFG